MADFPAVFFIFVTLIFVMKYSSGGDKYKYQRVKLIVISEGQSLASRVILIEKI